MFTSTNPAAPTGKARKPVARALAAGGGTLFVDMPLNSAPCTVNAQHFDAKRAALEAVSLTDFALWGGIVPGNLYDMADLAERGAVGFKAFMCDSGLPEFPRADDATLYFGMVEAARLNLPVAVHAESEEITKRLAQQLIAEARHDIRAFLESRPVAAEVEAIRRAGTFAREAGCRLHVVHISSGSGVAAALEARHLGTDISIETCPHYLFFSEGDLLRIGAIAKCAPPLRNIEERESLRHAARHGEIDIIGSDHSPCPPEMKDRASFFEIWGGIAGVQSTIPALLDIGSVTGTDCRDYREQPRAAVQSEAAWRARSRQLCRYRAGGSQLDYAGESGFPAASAPHQPVRGLHAERRGHSNHPSRRNHLRERCNYIGIPRPIRSCIVWVTPAAVASAITFCLRPILSSAPRCPA